MLEQAMGDKTITKLDTTTYDFFQKGYYTISIIYNADNYRQVCIISADYSTTIGVEELILNQTEKSQIAWDLLEQGGIKTYGFKILYGKDKLPNAEELKDIDFSQVRFR